MTIWISPACKFDDKPFSKAGVVYKTVIQFDTNLLALVFFFFKFLFLAMRDGYG